MRFDLTCNIALRAETGCELTLHVLPAQTGQQQLLHDVIWVQGCERWTISPRPRGARALKLIDCENEVHVAFAASLTIAPMWRHAAALWEPHANGFSGAQAAKRSSGPWSAERIVAALGRGLCSPPAAFAALPELFEWIQKCMGASELEHDLRDPAATSRRAVASQGGARPREATHGSQETTRGPQETTRTDNGAHEQLRFALAVFRALGVPARIAAGFAPEFVQSSPQDARAFNLELYRDGRWWVFEPDGHVPAFGFVRTALGHELSELALLEGPAHALSMQADVDPPPAWGLPLGSSSRLFLSLDAQQPGADSSIAPRQPEAAPSV